ncbi:hypothetical protein M8494_07300 [Serratia ureilytica]
MRPARVKEALPVFMFFHGGGWVLGDFPPMNGWCAIGAQLRCGGGVRQLSPLTGGALP